MRSILGLHLRIGAFTVRQTNNEGQKLSLNIRYSYSQHMVVSRHHFHNPIFKLYQFFQKRHSMGQLGELVLEVRQ